MKELKSLKDMGNPPDFKLNGDFFITIIYRTKGKVIQASIEPKRLKELKRHKVLTTPKYMEITGVAERTARRHLNDLVTQGYAEPVGEGPAREYRLIEK